MGEPQVDLGVVCGCRCHPATGLAPGYCCPECDPDSYELCDRCDFPVYAHNLDERPHCPGACDAVFDRTRDAKLRTAALEAAGQQRLFGGGA